MIELRVAGVQVVIHPLMALLLPLGMALGLKGDWVALLLSLSLHEMGHLLAARLAGVRVTRLTVMPFGCGIQLGNLYALTPGQLFGVSAGGPLASLGLLLVDGALAHWGLLSPAFALSLLQVTLALLLFNLLPALPLDGGRMLYALTVNPLGREAAVKLGAWLGYLTSIALTVAAVVMGIMTHRLNLTLPACAAFILKGIQDDRNALRDIRAATMLNALHLSDAPVPMRVCAVDESIPILRALRQAVPDAATLFAVYCGERLSHFTDERALMAERTADDAAPITSLEWESR